MQIIVLGFMGVIFAGGILLWLPVSNQQPITFLDALFTSTTAVCVTGLVTVVPATQFSLFGKIVLLMLIQIGGLGIIACASAFWIIAKRQITIKERILIQENYNMDALGGMVAMVLRIIKGTFLIEGIGAVLLSFQFVPEYGLLKGIWYGIFHSISAFCNAGVDILGDSSYLKYVENPIINITTILLIILSGIGFSVWHDVVMNVKEVFENKRPGKWLYTRLSLHSKLAISTTVILILAGTVNFLLAEYNNPATLGGLQQGDKFMAALFQSVTTRTAGFATLPQAQLTAESKLFSCILMFIGGSPGGTAGGIKTTTFAMLILAAWSVVKGGNDTECFGRKLPLINIRMGMAVVLMAVTTLVTGMLALTLLEPGMDYLDLMFEAFSAIGTVGLTADLTPHLGRASQIVIMIMMYIGRIGPISLALLFGGKMQAKDKIRELPEEKILVG